MDDGGERGVAGASGRIRVGIRDTGMTGGRLSVDAGQVVYFRKRER